MEARERDREREGTEGNTTIKAGGKNVLERGTRVKHEENGRREMRGEKEIGEGRKLRD